MNCHLCASPAVAIFFFSHGCQCDEKRWQPLCAHHAFKSGPAKGGSMTLIEDLTIGGEFTRAWSGKVAP